MIPLLSESLKLNPLKLTIPVILATSFAFMLPVATAPNAIVFSYGQLTIKDMLTTVSYEVLYRDSLIDYSDFGFN